MCATAEILAFLNLMTKFSSSVLALRFDSVELKGPGKEVALELVLKYFSAIIKAIKSGRNKWHNHVVCRLYCNVWIKETKQKN